MLGRVFADAHAHQARAPSLQLAGAARSGPAVRDLDAVRRTDLRHAFRSVDEGSPEESRSADEFKIEQLREQLDAVESAAEERARVAGLSDKRRRLGTATAAE